MAKQVISLTVDLSAEEASKQLDELNNKAEGASDSIKELGGATKTLKQQLKEAVNEAQLISQKFGETSKEAIAAQKKVAVLKEEISDFNDRVNALNPEAKFKAFGQALSGVAGGFAAAEGAMALFGGESEELQKTLLKVQAALALSQGIDQLRGLGDALKNVKVVGLDMLKSLKTAIIGHPIMALAAVIIAIGIAVMEWATSESELQAELKKSKKLEEERLNTAVKSYDRQIALAQKLGNQVTALEQAKQAAMIESAKKQLELDKQLELSTLKQTQSKLYLLSLTDAFLKSQYDKITTAIDNFDVYAKHKFKDETEAIKQMEQGLTDARIVNMAEAFKAVGKTADEANKKASDSAKKRNEDIVKLDEEFIANKRTANEQLLEIEVKESEDRDKRQQDQIERSRKYAEQDLAIQKKKLDDKAKMEEMHDKKVQELTIMGAQTTLSILTDLNSLGGKKSEAQAKRAFQIQKNIATATALVETYKSAQGAYASQLVPGDPTSPVRGTIAAAFAVAAGLARVAKIRSQQFNSTGSGGGGATSGGGQIPNMNIGATQNAQPTINSTQLNRPEIEKNIGVNIVNRISETEITSVQKRVGVIERRAKID